MEALDIIMGQARAYLILAEAHKIQNNHYLHNYYLRRAWSILSLVEVPAALPKAA